MYSAIQYGVYNRTFVIDWVHPPFTRSMCTFLNNWKNLTHVVNGAINNHVFIFACMHSSLYEMY